MKKITTLFLLICLASAPMWSQGRLGIKGGLNFNSLKDVSGSVNDSWNRQTGYHMGVTYQAKIPILGLGIQPELLFIRRKTESNNNPAQSMSLDFITLPVNVQIGLDLLLFRPFIMFSPFISYAIGKGDILSNENWDNINRFDYGYGLGAGVDIWKIQVSGKYVWGLGKLQDAGSTPINGDTFKNAKMEGFQLSVAWMF